MLRLKLHTVTCILVLAGCLPPALRGRSPDADTEPQPPVFVGVHLDSPVKFSRLKPGDELHGTATRNVYSGYDLLFPKGSRLRLKVSGMDRRRKEATDKWPWPAEYFRKKYKEFPTFDELTVSHPAGGDVSFPVSMATAFDEIHVVAQAAPATKSNRGSLPQSSGKNLNKRDREEPGTRLELVIKADAPKAGSTSAAGRPAMGANSAASPQPGFMALAPGTEAKLALMGPLSASKSRPGDSFKAMLAEPLRLSSGEVLPQGALFEGSVRKSTGPRWLSRPGSLYLTVNRLVLPTGACLPIAASVVGVETNRNSQMTVDSEGGMSGGPPGKKRLLIDLGIGFGFAKLADDTYQLIDEALVSTATDASTAGTARLIGMAVGGLLFIKRHGRDVVLPPYTMIDIRFDRTPPMPAPKVQHQGMR